MIHVTGKTEQGASIVDLQSWFENAPPAGGAAQWKDYRSAKELARAWCDSGSMECPHELKEALDRDPATRGLTIEQAVAEMEIGFDEFRGGKRNADLALWGTASAGHRVAVTVEAKADESLGPTVQKQLDDAPIDRGSNIPTRVERLSCGIVGHSVDDEIKPLRYQLFHALAATAKLAKTTDATHGILMIHEFVSLTLDFEKFTENANDLNKFIQAIPGWETATLKCGDLLTPIQLPGSESVPNDVLVSIGKIRTLIPLGSGGRGNTKSA
ncbi:hypothetical protein Mal15_29340 [Stieleria maiorica]|uniref:DUF6946 domain-containing protein n=1 Tax=Stieleria maiorica TaxID=2795974 RepID=A0A5B9MFB8_9BACT|nr:hypothetical protein [Stieleria maiorica]QEF98876.1 hypothetical protein Mal15_29340 [Stieleria maiorica]